MKKGLLGLSMAMLAMSAAQDYSMDKGSEFLPDSKPQRNKKQKRNIEKTNIEVPIKKGLIKYWFIRNGAFLNEKQSERFKTEEIYFTCFALNDHNAMKKFKKFHYDNVK